MGYYDKKLTASVDYHTRALGRAKDQRTQQYHLWKLQNLEAYARNHGYEIRFERNSRGNNKMERFYAPSKSVMVGPKRLRRRPNRAHRKRRSRTSHVYYEHRRNRFDIPPLNFF